MKKVLVLVSLVLVNACSSNTTRFNTLKQYSNVKEAREFELKFYEAEGVKPREVGDNVIVYEKKSPLTTYLYPIAFINPLNYTDYYCIHFENGEQKYGRITLWEPFNFPREYVNSCNGYFVAPIQNNDNKKEVVIKKVVAEQKPVVAEQKPAVEEKVVKTKKPTKK